MTNHTNVHCVTNFSLCPATCSNINVMYTVTVDHNECPFCGKLFQTNMELKHHVRIHTDAKPYSCRHRSGRFTRPEQLKTHLLKSHNEGRWLICSICQKKFATKGKLKQHLLRHDDVKPYVCSECPKCFYTAYELTRHQPVHSDYKQFCCGLCVKDFKHKRCVKIHFKKCSARFGCTDVWSSLT